MLVQKEMWLLDQNQRCLNSGGHQLQRALAQQRRDRHQIDSCASCLWVWVRLPLLPEESTTWMVWCHDVMVFTVPWWPAWCLTLAFEALPILPEPGLLPHFCLPKLGLLPPGSWFSSLFPPQDGSWPTSPSPPPSTWKSRGLKHQAGNSPAQLAPENLRLLCLRVFAAAVESPFHVLQLSLHRANNFLMGLEIRNTNDGHWSIIPEIWSLVSVTWDLILSGNNSWFVCARELVKTLANQSAWNSVPRWFKDCPSTISTNSKTCSTSSSDLSSCANFGSFASMTCSF